jgi:AcrR family transcriptional regulator
MTAVSSPSRLPRGRHRLSREQVEQAQRLRLAAGLCEAMRTNGYAGTPVADILRHAGISRETFYELYEDKLGCFLDTLDLIAEILLEHLTVALERPGTPMRRFDRALAGYLELLASEPGYARVMLVEVYAAGPLAIARRTDLQRRIAESIADLFGTKGQEGGFAAEAVVAAISSMVTPPVVAGDGDRVRGLRKPLLRHVRRLLDSGVL